MNKTQTIEAMEKARAVHIAQMDKIELVLKGKEVKNPTSVSQTKCAFGKWLYADENQLERIIGELFYTKLEKLHAKWHQEYFRIYELCFKGEKKGFFSKMMGSKALEPMVLDKVKFYYTELQETTDDLLKVLATSQRRIEAMNESRFD